MAYCESRGGPPIAVGDTAMANADQTKSAGPGRSDGDGPVPVMQRVLDNPFLLLFLGVTIPAVFYLLWGVMEVANIPIGR